MGGDQSSNGIPVMWNKCISQQQRNGRYFILLNMLYQLD